MTPFVYDFLGSVNFFRGKLEAAGVRIGGSLLAAADAGLAPGTAVVACARPHDIDLLAPGTGVLGVPARISRIFRFGALARIELDGRDEVAGQVFEAEVGASELDALSFKEGSHIVLSPRRVRIFEQRAGTGAQPDGIPGAAPLVASAAGRAMAGAGEQRSVGAAA